MAQSIGLDLLAAAATQKRHEAKNNPISWANSEGVIENEVGIDMETNQQ